MVKVERQTDAGIRLILFMFLRQVGSIQVYNIYMGYIVIDVLLSSCALDLHIGFAYVCGSRSAYDWLMAVGSGTI